MFFLLKNTVKIALQYLFNDFKLFNSFFNLKLNFKLRKDPKKSILKTKRKFTKNIWQPHICYINYTVDPKYVLLKIVSYL